MLCFTMLVGLILSVVIQGYALSFHCTDCYYSGYTYAEWLYHECRYAECRGALQLSKLQSNVGHYLCIVSFKIFNLRFGVFHHFVFH